MKFTKYLAYGTAALCAVMATSCVDDLNVKPTDPNIILRPTDKGQLLAELGSVYNDLVTGDGLNVSDGGAGSWTRCHFNLQELTSDECFISQKWNDPGYEVLNFNTWNNTNEWLYAAYSRENHLAKVASVFISDLNNFGTDFFTPEEIKAMDAEARTLRAFANWNLIDLFGRGPWITEESQTGYAPESMERKQLFEATVADLKPVLDNLIPAAQQAYGRISREAGYMLLAKLYLNAEVYTGTPMWQECADALQHVVNTGLELAPEYKYLFCADNHRFVGNGEIIWGLPQQQGETETYAGTTYLTAGAWMESADTDFLHSLNAKDTWSGLRLRPELSRALKGDPRRLIYEGTYKEDIPDLASFDAKSCGYMLIKYTNTNSDDYENTRVIQNNKETDAAIKVIEDNPDLSKEEKDKAKAQIEAGRMAYNNNTAISNADFPIFRLADAYLMMAECQLHGIACNGFELLNKVRARVGLDPITSPSASDILRERQCELYMEGHRRQDLIRFNRYTGATYRWSWKGGEYEGISIPEYRALFPVPYQFEVTVGQNPGY